MPICIASSREIACSCAVDGDRQRAVEGLRAAHRHAAAGDEARAPRGSAAARSRRPARGGSSPPRRARARRASAAPLVSIVQAGVRDRVAVRVVRRVAELLVDARLELLRENVLEPVGLVVHRVDRNAERLGEVLLEQPVVADDLERDLRRRPRESSTPWYGECSTRPSAASFFSIDVADEGATPMPARDRGRRRARPLGLELVDLLQVVLDRRRELRFRHASNSSAASVVRRLARRAC